MTLTGRCLADGHRGLRWARRGRRALEVQQAGDVVAAFAVSLDDAQAGTRGDFLEEPEGLSAGAGGHGI